MSKKLRFLVLVTKGWTEEYIASILENAGKELETLGVSSYRLMDSGTWFRERFPACGDWDSWIWESVNGVDYITREVHFDGFILTSIQMGRANASIAALALRNKRAVLALEENQPLKKVTAINADNVDDWAEGWSYDAERIGG